MSPKDMQEQIEKEEWQREYEASQYPAVLMMLEQAKAQAQWDGAATAPGVPPVDGEDSWYDHCPKCASTAVEITTMGNMIMVVEGHEHDSNRATCRACGFVFYAPDCACGWKSLLKPQGEKP